MIWFGFPLSAEQLEVAELVRDVLSGLPDIEDAVSGAEDTGKLAEARAGVVESGLWSIGIDDESGGGGAGLDLKQVALLALGATQPALAWAIAQAHAAAEVLAAGRGQEQLLSAVVAGQRAVCVVELDEPHVRLDTADGVVGRIGRLDPCGDAPAVVVLDGFGAAWILAPSALTVSDVHRRTGFAGALTVSAEVNATGELCTHIEGIDADAIRARLQLAGAAIAAGLAAAAAEASLAYSRERMQFGAPLTALPTVRSALRQQGAAATEAIAVVLTQTPYSAARSAAVLHDNCERAIAVTASSVQSHGGYGYLREYRVERMVRDAVSLRAAAGAARGTRRIADRLTPA